MFQFQELKGKESERVREISFILQSGFDAVVIAGEEISLHLLYSGLLWQWLSEVEILTSKKKKQDCGRVSWYGWITSFWDVGGGGGGLWEAICWEADGGVLPLLTCLAQQWSPSVSRHLLTRLLLDVMDRSAAMKKEKERKGSAIENMPGMETSDIRGSLAQIKAPFTALSLMCLLNSAVNTILSPSLSLLSIWPGLYTCTLFTGSMHEWCPARFRQSSSRNGVRGWGNAEVMERK